MTAQNTQGKLKHDIRTIAELFSPVASHNGVKPKPDFDEEAAQERRRQERLKRKKEEKRDDEELELEEEESENLVPESRKAKRKKKKKERPALWVNEDELDEVFETNERNGKHRRNREEDWLGDWDE